ncbi:MAG: restriction endonuclease subunit S [Leptospiraceae bacterium]|nr:restriction endonuclease subunit S [Leptospiraceae bacterium]
MKDSGIEWLGEIPEDWEVKRLKYFTKINPSKSELSTCPKNMQVTFLPMENIGEKGELDTSLTKELSEVINGYSYLRENDVIIAKITPCFENGKGAIAKGLTNNIAFATTEVITLRCENEKSSVFLYYLLYSSPFRKIAEGTMYGAGGQKRVADSFVANYHFSLPSLTEQKAIAEFLDRETTKIDKLIEKAKESIELSKEKRQALISAAVTGKIDVRDMG